MYVKMMHQPIGVPHSEGENDFTMFQIHKGQSVALWQSPGKGMELQINENGILVYRSPLYGPVYVMSESGKTIATYAASLKATGELLAACNEMQEPQVSR